VVLDRNAGKLAVHKVTSGSWGGAIDSTAATINDSTAYTILVERKQRQIKARLVGQTVSIDSGSLSDLEAGETGFFSDKTNVTFGHFTALNAATRATLTPRIGGLVNATISSGKLAVTGSTRYGEAVVEGFSDDYYMLTADVEVSGTNVARVFFHYTDPNNAYFIELDTTAAAVKLIEIVNGATSAITTGTYTSGASVPVKIKVYDDAGAQRIKIWVNGTLRINTTDASHPTGRDQSDDSPARPRVRSIVKHVLRPAGVATAGG
jgi:hypothetical protein